MGQQQLLLIVLGVIIIGIAVAIAILLFQASAIQNKRDLLMNETIHIGNLAQRYYYKPSALGGGEKSFEGWEIPKDLEETANGTFVALIEEQMVEITGTGNEIVTGNDFIQVKTIVLPSKIETIVVH